MASRYRLTAFRTRDGYPVYVDPATGDVACEDWGCTQLVPVPTEQEEELAALAATGRIVNKGVIVTLPAPL